MLVLAILKEEEYSNTHYDGYMERYGVWGCSCSWCGFNLSYCLGAVTDIATRDGMTLDNVEIHGRECDIYPVAYVGERLGSVTQAQVYADQNNGVDSVCFAGETKEGAVWYSVG